MPQQQIVDHGSRAMRMASPPRIEFRSSTRALLFYSGMGWAFLAALIVVIAVGSWFGYWWQTLIGIAVVAIPLLLYQYLVFRTATFALDDGRLFMCRGVFVRIEEEVELYRIKDVKVTFSVIQQMFSVGGIRISSSDASGSIGAGATNNGRTVITVPHVLDARAIREEIRNRVEAARERRGVRELDIG